MTNKPSDIAKLLRDNACKLSQAIKAQREAGDETFIIISKNPESIVTLFHESADVIDELAGAADRLDANTCG